MKLMFSRVATAALMIATFLFAVSPAASAQVEATVGERCATAKIRAAARNAQAQLDCAAHFTLDVDFDMDRCIERAGVLLTKAYAKAEADAARAGGSCGTVADAEDIELEAADFCSLIVGLLPPD